MRYLLWLATACFLSAALPALGVELQPLAECSVKVFREINRKGVWSGKSPVGCVASIHVEKRSDGVFVTAWSSNSSEAGWVRVSLSTAMGFFEVVDRETLERAGHDIMARAAHIERCLNSIIRVNDPLDCRDYATKTYSAAAEFGIEYNRSLWLDDTGRHCVVEFSYGDSRGAVGPPVDLFR